MAITRVLARISWLIFGLLSFGVAGGLFFQMKSWVVWLLEQTGGNERVTALLLLTVIGFLLIAGAVASSIWWNTPTASFLKEPLVSAALFITTVAMGIVGIFTFIPLMGALDGDPWSGLPYLWGAFLTFGGASMLVRTFR